uniref:Adipogenesis regulatory factor n=2 Tax=Myotis myotis TaxID=51298 RepID=A0A7J7RMF7_MYOMY|nr:adipogenesis regulatory factor [Myotis myotis]
MGEAGWGGGPPFAFRPAPFALQCGEDVPRAPTCSPEDPGPSPRAAVPGARGGDSLSARAGSPRLSAPPLLPINWQHPFHEAVKVRKRPDAPGTSRSRPLDQTSSATRRPRRSAAMAGKGWQDLKQQVEGTAQEAVTATGAAAQQVVDQAAEAGQKAMDQVAKTTQETVDKTATQASETFSGFGKKLGLLK